MNIYLRHSYRPLGSCNSAFVIARVILVIALCSRIPLQGVEADCFDEPPASAEPPKPTALAYHPIDEQLRSLNFCMTLEVSVAQSQLRQFEEIVGSRFAGTWRMEWLKAWQHEINVVSKLTDERRKLLFQDFEIIRHAENGLSRITSVKPILSQVASAVDRIAEVLDDRCPTYAYALGILAGLKGLNADYHAAAKDWEHVRELHKHWVGVGNLMYIADCELVASSAIDTRDYAKATKILQECLDFYLDNADVSSRRIRAIKSALAITAIRNGQYEDGIKAMEAVFTIREPQNQEELLFQSKCLHHLGIAYGKTNRSVVAQASFESALNAYRRLSFANGHPTVLRVLADELEFYEESRQTEKAHKLKAELEQLRLARPSPSPSDK